MKIQGIQCFRLRAKVDDVRGGGSRWVTSRSALFVKVTTDDGLVGWGEAGQTGSTLITKHLIEQIIAPIYPNFPEKLYLCHVRGVGYPRL